MDRGFLAADGGKVLKSQEISCPEDAEVEGIQNGQRCPEWLGTGGTGHHTGDCAGGRCYKDGAKECVLSSERREGLMEVFPSGSDRLRCVSQKDRVSSRVETGLECRKDGAACGI